jgi:RNA recognition motif-containing protein
MNKKIFVGNLDFDVKDIELEELFKTVGKVLTAEIVRFFDKKSKGFGFVEMGAVEEAKMAIEKLNGSEFRGRQLVVSETKENNTNPINKPISQ